VSCQVDVVEGGVVRDGDAIVLVDCMKASIDKEMGRCVVLVAQISVKKRDGRR
jgi:hypothetical protein